MIFELLYSGASAQIVVIMLICVLAAVIISLSLHEFAHAFIAHKCGDDTAKVNGRMTINPLKHLDPVGFLMLVMLGFGFAKPVPINPYNFKKMRRDYFFVSVAGITVNLILAFVCSLVFVVIGTYAAPLLFDYLLKGYMVTPSNFADVMLYFFFFMMSMNLGLMLFNLIPIFPLDGFRIVESVSGRNNRFVSFMRKNGQYILIGLLIWSVVIGFICNYVAQETAAVLQYFDVLGYALKFLIGNIANGFTSLWRLMFK